MKHDKGITKEKADELMEFLWGVRDDARLELAENDDKNSYGAGYEDGRVHLVTQIEEMLCAASEREMQEIAAKENAS